MVIAVSGGAHAPVGTTEPDTAKLSDDGMPGEIGLA
jgi:hypothetical protein